VCAVVPEQGFILVGDGPLRSQLEEQVRRLGIGDHFILLGRREDVPEILSCGDLSVLASFAEGLPNSVLEASAAGLPDRRNIGWRDTGNYRGRGHWFAHTSKEPTGPSYS